jgi:hypothetical protein
MAAIKKSRKELLKKPDEFMTFTGKAIRLVSDNQKPISYALCAVVASSLATGSSPSVEKQKHFQCLSKP